MTVLSKPMVLLGLLLLATCMSAQARDKAVGTAVRAVGGSVIVSRQDEPRPLKAQDRIHAGDTIITADGWVTINFYDLTRVVLRPDTEFVVHQFPTTKDQGVIELSLLKGAARLTTGTIAAQARDRFSLLTPQGRMHAGKAEWVVRICADEQCRALEQTFKRCGRYQPTDSTERQFLSVYRGSVRPAYCPGAPQISVGQSLVQPLGGQRSNQCQKLQEVPCFVLFDGKLGRDKARKLMKRLTPVKGKRPSERGNRPAPRGGRGMPRRR